MRFALLLSLVASALSASPANAQEWCGYPDKSVVQCGFSTVASCQQSVGKDGFCFADPAES